MRIALVLSSPIPPQEGIGFYAWNLARFLQQQGHAVSLITRGDHRPTYCETIAGIPVWKVTFLPLYPFHVHLHSLFVNRLLRKMEGELDIVHLHTPLVKSPATALPVFVTVHSPMQTASQAIPMNTPLGMLIQLQTPVSIAIEKELFHNADGLSAVSRQTARDLLPYGVAQERVKVLGNGVDTLVFRPAASPAPSTPPYFLTAGRLSPGKGLDDLVDCAAIIAGQHPQVRFLIAGTGPAEADLRRKIRQAGMEATIQLLGHIQERARLVELYQGALAYVHPSHYEGMPTVILEAMACARPVVSTAVSGALDVIADGQNGLLVPPHAPAALAQALLRLLADPALGASLGAAALDTIQQRYSWETVSRAYLAEYQALVERANDR